MDAAVEDIEGRDMAAGRDAENGNYQRLALFMTRCPDTAIFRKFATLNMLNLLRLQAELQDMEQNLQDIAEEDRTSGDKLRKEYGRSFRLMRECKENKEKRNNKMILDTMQYDLLVKMGEKLKEYNKALKQAKILNREPPIKKTDLDNIQIWLSSRGGFLSGIEANVWRWENQSDFMALRPRSAGDLFSRFLNGSFLKIYHTAIGKKTASEGDVVDGFRMYDDDTLKRISDGIVVAISAVLPTVAVLVLHYIDIMIYRIVAVIIFTTLFSIAVAIFTEADKFGVFSATAAFAAVEVVYVGSSSL